ncbi:MAG: hypothetical protein JO110_05120 [Acetobacteraceae bacterium]|nr:hypothetical protein [Acetobacteraceae bacterium]
MVRLIGQFDPCRRVITCPFPSARFAVDMRFAPPACCYTASTPLGGISRQPHAMHGVTRGVLTTKIHAAVDASGNAISLKLSAGQAHDGRSAADLLDTLAKDKSWSPTALMIGTLCAPPLQSAAATRTSSRCRTRGQTMARPGRVARNDLHGHAIGACLHPEGLAARHFSRPWHAGRELPVRTMQSTASTNNRACPPVRPGSVGLPGQKGSMSELLGMAIHDPKALASIAPLAYE